MTRTYLRTCVSRDKCTYDTSVLVTRWCQIWVTSRSFHGIIPTVVRSRRRSRAGMWTKVGSKCDEGAISNAVMRPHLRKIASDEAIFRWTTGRVIIHLIIMASCNADENQADFSSPDAIPTRARDACLIDLRKDEFFPHFFYFYSSYSHEKLFLSELDLYLQLSTLNNFLTTRYLSSNKVFIPNVRTFTLYYYIYGHLNFIY